MASLVCAAKPLAAWPLLHFQVLTADAELDSGEALVMEAWGPGSDYAIDRMIQVDQGSDLRRVVNIQLGSPRKAPAAIRSLRAIGVRKALSMRLDLIRITLLGSPGRWRED